MREGYLVAFAQDHQSLETLYKIFLKIGGLEQRLVISVTQIIGHDVHSSRSICVYWRLDFLLFLVIRNFDWLKNNSWGQ